MCINACLNFRCVRQYYIVSFLRFWWSYRMTISRKTHFICWFTIIGWRISSWKQDSLFERLNYLDLTKISINVAGNFINQLTLKICFHEQIVECLICNNVYNNSMLGVVLIFVQIESDWDEKKNLKNEKWIHWRLY